MSKINDLEQEVKADVKEATEAVSAENADKPWFKRLSLTTWIFIALALGVVTGLALQGTPDIATTYIKPLGTIFLNLIKMIVVPLVIFSMIAGVISLSDIKKVGAIGGKTIAYYHVHHRMRHRHRPDHRERVQRWRRLHPYRRRAFV